MENTTNNTTTNQSIWVVSASWRNADGFDDTQVWLFNSREGALRLIDKKWGEEITYLRDELSLTITDEMTAYARENEGGYWEWDGDELVQIEDGYHADLILERRDDYIHIYTNLDYASIEYVVFERKIED